VKREYWVAGLMALTAMFTLIGYEFMRSASTVLFKNAYGSENLPLVMAAMPFVVFGTVWAYGHILTALGPHRTLIVTSLGSGMLILACYFMLLTGSKAVTPILFLIKEVYIVLLIEQYWSYINSSVSSKTARRVNGPVTGVAGLGSAAGGILVGLTVTDLGTETMILLGALALLPSALVAHLTYKTHGEPEVPQVENVKSHMGWRWLKENPTLFYLLMIVLSTQVVSAVLDFKFQDLLSIEYAGRQDEETAFQGWFWATLNTSSVVLQFVAAPILLSLVSLRLIHIMMPIIHITAITIAIMEPSVLTVGVAFALFKAFDYSIFRAAKEVLYVPLSYDERYRAKEIIDVFGYRTGKGASSVVIVALQRLGVAMSNYYLAVAFCAVAVWLALIFPLTRRAKAILEEETA
jgi:AAA family ATP:ADP antiporter